MKSHSRKGRFVRVAENLYRYSASKTYYAVYSGHGKLAWKNLKTTDAELAKRKLKDQVAKAGRIDARQARMTLEDLLRLLEDGLDRFDVRTRANRKTILTAFKRTWKHGLGLPVQDDTPAQLNVWLAQHSARM